MRFWFLQQLDQLESRRSRLLCVSRGVNAPYLRPGGVLMAAAAPRTAGRLQSRGVEVLTMPYREIHHNSGSVHRSMIELIRNSVS
jgi:hypothetical protein